MRFEKRLPRRFPSAHRGRFDAVFPQNVSDTRVRQLQAKILQRALNAVIAPRRILLRHLHYQSGNLVRNSRGGQPACAARCNPTFCATSSRCHRKSVSGVTIVSSSRNARRPNAFAFTASLRRCALFTQHPPFAQLLSENPVLGLQVFDDPLLLAVEACRKKQCRNVPRLEYEVQHDANPLVRKEHDRKLRHRIKKLQSWNTQACIPRPTERPTCP